MTLGASGCGQCVGPVGVVTGSSGCDQWVGPSDVVTGCGQWVVDIMFVSVLFGSLVPTFCSIFKTLFFILVFSNLIRERIVLESFQHLATRASEEVFQKLLSLIQSCTL